MIEGPAEELIHAFVVRAHLLERRGDIQGAFALVEVVQVDEIEGPAIDGGITWARIDGRPVEKSVTDHQDTIRAARPDIVKRLLCFAVQELRGAPKADKLWVKQPSEVGQLRSAGGANFVYEAAPEPKTLLDSEMLR